MPIRVVIFSTWDALQVTESNRNLLEKYLAYFQWNISDTKDVNGRKLIILNEHALGHFFQGHIKSICGGCSIIMWVARVRFLRPG